MQNLVIVESPTKARTLEKYLGSKYTIDASMGHIRDLPKSELGVDVEHNFEPKYIIPRDKRKKANELKKLASQAKVVWLASDPDREGEAIAWHIEQLITGGKKSKIQIIKRVVFHEITPEAIKDAFDHPRKIDYKLVDAQQARRVLDRLVGYKLSPLLWKKVKRGISAGRVQSVALRLIVEREREIKAFKAEEYWSIDVILSVTNDKNNFTVTLIEVNGKKVEIKNEKAANNIVSLLEKSQYKIDKITKKEVKKYPLPPFITSTLQQFAANRLGFSAKQTMMVAQSLYEHGYITYMRTDSVNLSSFAVNAAREYINQFLGSNYLPSAPRVFKSKSRNAQEAHEAIRPTNVNLVADKLKEKDGINRDHTRLYDLIWKRFIASQITDALLDQTTIDVVANSVESQPHSMSSSAKADLRALNGAPRSSTNTSYLLRATGSVIKFDGWLKVYGKNQEEDLSQDKKEHTDEKILASITQKAVLSLVKILPQQHFTQGQPRFNEASLIKTLEELGIGRPSTYAPILSTIQERFYVEKQDRRFVPTALGFAAIDFLVKYFSNILDYTFTAQMEDQLDEVARGEREWKPAIKEFYDPFAKKIDETEKTAEKIVVEIETTDKICSECGKPLIVRIGKFGKFLACSGFPECKHTEGLEEKIDGKCPQDEGDIVVRKTRHGRIFYGCKNWPTCKYASWTKPVT